MKSIYICTSKIHGNGIFAGENIKRGEFIQPIRGPVKFKINKNIKDSLGSPNWIGVANNQWIDPRKPFKFINHSCDATAGIKGKICIVALKDIREGEEITLDYSTVEADDNWQMSCSCGKLNCRKIIKSVRHLPIEQFNKYLPFIPTYFKKLYMRYNSSNGIKARQNNV